MVTGPLRIQPGELNDFNHLAVVPIGFFQAGFYTCTPCAPMGANPMDDADTIGLIVLIVAAAVVFIASKAQSHKAKVLAHTEQAKYF
jgi:hypothetical protein